MKSLHYICIAFVLATAFTSCKKEINGSGHFVVENRVVAPFTEVTSCGDYNVILKEDSVSRIEIYAEDNILPEIETEVDGTNLRLYFRKFHYNYDHNGITITVYNPVFKGIDMQGSGNITSHDALHANSMRVNISGSGTIDLAVFTSTLTSNISGSGKIYFMGVAANAQHTISGSGKTAAFDLQSKNVVARISGSGNCEVNVSEYLSAIISGSGNIIYRGNPAVTKNISGSGNVRHE